MKEVTRVHIAKVSYDIEVEAKKELESYISKLERYAADTDIMEDIEIRITELLTERGVSRGGVISTEDVAAIRARLGEPENFASDDELADAQVAAHDEAVAPKRRLYRDMDGAVIGGVLSGFGKYLGLSALWTRLVFLILMVGSFGSVLVIYVVLWLAVPAARTAAEKLELEGKPVTLESIRERGAQQVENATPKLLGRVMLVLAGLGSLGLAIGAFILTAVVVFGVSVVPESVPVFTVAVGFEWINQLAIVLFVLSGLLLSSLGIMLAYAAFAKRFSRKMGIATIAIVLAGLLSFGAGLATISAGAYYESQYLQESIEEKKVDLGDEFATVKSLVAAAHSVRSASSWGGGYEMSIEYVVDPGKPRYVLTSLPGVRVDVSVKDGQARVALKSSYEQNRAFNRAVQPRLTIYGPALSEVSVQQGDFTYTTAYQEQQDLVIDALPTTTVSTYGSYGTLTVKGGGTVMADSSTVQSLVARQDDGRLSAGVVRTLNVEQVDVCPAEPGDGANQVTVRGVSSGAMVYNSSEKPAKTIVRDCGMVVIGDDEDMEGWQD